MNREIKFKAKLRDYSDWVCGYYEKVGEHHFITASDEVAYLIDPATICQLITKIGDVEIYEYDCWYDKKLNRIEYLSYEVNGQLGVQSYSFKNDKLEHIHYTLNLDMIKSLRTSILKNELIFIGNWHDGEEYLLNKIKEVGK
jgi:hypothetical protein